MSWNNPLNIPLGYGIGKIQCFNGITIEDERLQNGRHKKPTRNGFEAFHIVPYPIPGIESCKVRVNIRSTFLERRISIARKTCKSSENSKQIISQSLQLHTRL